MILAQVLVEGLKRQVKYMKLQAVVRYRGAWAHYNISPKRTGICEAQLFKWEGEEQPAPPEQILLLRSIRHWVGSADDSSLIDELGEVIETNTRNRDSLSPEGR